MRSRWGMSGQNCELTEFSKTGPHNVGKKMENCREKQRKKQQLGSDRRTGSGVTGSLFRTEGRRSPP